MKLKQRTILRAKYYVYRVGGHCISCKRNWQSDYTKIFIQHICVID